MSDYRYGWPVHPRHRTHEFGRTVLVTATTEDVVPLAELKLWLREEEEQAEQDELLVSLLATARARYEAYTNRIPLKQTYDEVFDCPPDRAIAPNKFPLVSVTSIKGFTDTDATDTGGTSMSSSQYYVDTAGEPGRIVALAGFTLPIATRVANGTIIRYVAGHSTSSTGVPDHIKTTLKNMVARAFGCRGDQTAADSAMDDVLLDEFSVPEWG